MLIKVSISILRAGRLHQQFGWPPPSAKREGVASISSREGAQQVRLRSRENPQIRIIVIASVTNTVLSMCLDPNVSSPVSLPRVCDLEFSLSILRVVRIYSRQKRRKAANCKK